MASLAVTRRTFLALAAALAVRPGRLPGGPLPPSDWPQHGYGPEQTRHNLFERSLDEKAAPRLRLLWELDARAAVTATPAIVGESIVFGDWNGVVRAIDRRTTEELWRFESGTREFPPDRRLGVFAGCAVADGRVVVASDRLFALDLETGKLLWERVVGDPEATGEYFWAAPLVHGGRVYAGVSAGSETVTRGRIVALDATTGELLWETFTVAEDVAGGALVAPPSLDLATGTLFAATGNPFHERPGRLEHANSLLAIDAATGKIVWNDQVHPHDTKNLDLNCPPMLATVDDGKRRRRLAIVGGKDGLRAWDRTTRKRLWRVQLTPEISPGETEALPTNGPEAGPVAFAGGTAFFASNDHDAKTCVVAAIEAATGRIRWRRTLPAYQFAPLSVAAGVVYIGLVDGKLRALRARDGEILWESGTVEPIAGGPAVARGMVVVGSGAGQFLLGTRLYAFAPEGEG